MSSAGCLTRIDGLKGATAVLELGSAATNLRNAFEIMSPQNSMAQRDAEHFADECHASGSVSWSFAIRTDIRVL